MIRILERVYQLPWPVSRSSSVYLRVHSESCSRAFLATRKENCSSFLLGSIHHNCLQKSNARLTVRHAQLNQLCTLLPSNACLVNYRRRNKEVPVFKGLLQTGWKVLPFETYRQWRTQKLFIGGFHLYSVCVVCDVTKWRHSTVSKPTFWRSLLT